MKSTKYIMLKTLLAFEKYELRVWDCSLSRFVIEFDNNASNVEALIWLIDWVENESGLLWHLDFVAHTIDFVINQDW